MWEKGSWSCLQKVKPFYNTRHGGIKNKKKRSYFARTLKKESLKENQWQKKKIKNVTSMRTKPEDSTLDHLSPKITRMERKVSYIYSEINKKELNRKFSV